MTNREDLLFEARISEQCDRYEDMLETMKKIIAFGDNLSPQDRNLLSVAYKNNLSGRRNAWRVLESLERKEEKKGTTQHVNLIKEYKQKIFTELTGICNDLISLLDKTLIPGAKDADSQVFYYKMKGDYYRYISEACAGDAYEKAGDNALQAYNQATEKAKQLKPTNPIRLGLALNFSVFHYEVKKNATQACLQAKNAFDDAIATIDDIEQDQYKDATTIMQLIRDNLTLWTNEVDNDGPEA